MSIFKRLYTIARAEVNSRLRSTTGGKSWSQRQKSESESSSKESSGGYWGEEDDYARQDAANQQRSKHDQQIADWYAALELPEGSDLDAVQKAWRRLLRQFHPDKHAADDEKARVAHEVTQQLNEAYNGLKKHLSA